MGIVGDGVSEVVNLSLEQIRLASESGRPMRYPDTALPDMVPQGNAQMAPSRGNISSLAKEKQHAFCEYENRHASRGRVWHHDGIHCCAWRERGLECW